LDVETGSVWESLLACDRTPLSASLVSESLAPHEVFERCLSGAQRDVDLRQVEGVLDDVNGVIARMCEPMRQSVRPAGPAGVP